LKPVKFQVQDQVRVFVSDQALFVDRALWFERASDEIWDQVWNKVRDQVFRKLNEAS
jgi:hypothetical protein